MNTVESKKSELDELVKHILENYNDIFYDNIQRLIENRICKKYDYSLFSYVCDQLRKNKFMIFS